MHTRTLHIALYEENTLRISKTLSFPNLLDSPPVRLCLDLAACVRIIVDILIVFVVQIHLQSFDERFVSDSNVNGCKAFEANEIKICIVQSEHTSTRAHERNAVSICRHLNNTIIDCTRSIFKISPCSRSQQVQTVLRRSARKWIGCRKWCALTHTDKNVCTPNTRIRWMVQSVICQW